MFFLKKILRIKMNKVREPAVSGMFYPASPEELKDQINFLMERNKPTRLFDDIVGIVSPHAGYPYSGGSAAVAFNVLKKVDFNTVIIISPSHSEYFQGICIYNGDAYQTPLGEVSINKDVRDRLVEESELIYTGIDGHGSEHALEVQIPFLQIIKDEFSIIPIVIGDQRSINIDDLAKALSKVMDDKTVIISSSDLSHFHSKEEADRLDLIVENHITDFTFEELQSDLDNNNCEACGGGGIVALMKTAELLNKRNTFVLSRTDSGTVTGDYSRVVGYLSAVIYGG